MANTRSGGNTPSDGSSAQISSKGNLVLEPRTRNAEVEMQCKCKKKFIRRLGATEVHATAAPLSHRRSGKYRGLHAGARRRRRTNHAPRGVSGTDPPARLRYWRAHALAPGVACAAHSNAPPRRTCAGRWRGSRGGCAGSRSIVPPFRHGDPGNAQMHQIANIVNFCVGRRKLERRGRYAG
jgi:hypothetical protein